MDIKKLIGELKSGLSVEMNQAKTNKICAGLISEADILGGAEGIILKTSVAIAYSEGLKDGRKTQEDKV